MNNTWFAIDGFCYSYSFAFIVPYFIIVIIQTYLIAVNISNIYQVYSVECVSEIKSIILIIVYDYRDNGTCALLEGLRNANVHELFDGNP